MAPAKSSVAAERPMGMVSATHFSIAARPSNLFDVGFIEGDIDPAGAERVHDRMAAQPDVSVGRPVEAGDHAQGRRLAAARRPEKEEERPTFDRQTYVIYRNDIAETLADIDELDVGGLVQTSLRCGRPAARFP